MNSQSQTVATTGVHSTASLGSLVRVFHVIGQSQYKGTCKMHLYRDCTYLVRPRTQQGWDRTGAIHEDSQVLPHRYLCKVCARRAALPDTPSLSPLRDFTT